MISPQTLTGRLAIGALLPMTGQFRQFGQDALDLLRVSLKQCRELLSTVAPYADLQLLVEDNGPGGPGLTASVERILSQGVTITIGGENSEQLAEIMPLLAKGSTAHINYLSTAPSLAAADGVFRMLPQDRHEGAWMAELMHGSGEGIRTLIPVWRGDRFGDELVAAMSARFVELGGSVAAGVRYPADTTDFAPAVRAAAAQINESFRRVQSMPAAVYLAGFDEAAPLFRAAAAEPALPLVKWYGSNGTVLADSLVQDPVAATYAARVHFTNPAIALPDFALPKWRAAMLEAGMDLAESPNVFTLLAYDAFWMAVQTALALGSVQDAASFRRALARRADFFCGASGWCAFDTAGDRRAMPFALWDVRKSESGYAWSL
jgi:branched-chain amino acid transport system substrate-binding protein